ncbi:MAG: aspartate kinase [Spirochaetaceae bacterium]|jgi:aspartokinase/homoserine dehydrogenase 1|nr:aspartate kinase [Spirochaetaceae bacterium]
MRVLKFGGTSVGSAKALKALVSIVEKELNEGDASKNGKPRALIVSALSGVTDSLLAYAKSGESGEGPAFKALQDRHFSLAAELMQGDDYNQTKAILDTLFDELQKTERTENTDPIASFGERLSANLITCYFKAKGINAEYLDARELVISDNRAGQANVHIEKTYENISDYFNKHSALQIVTGFIARDSQKKTTTLGRGGSDLSAALFGAALKADIIEIWTDVDGILTCDPKKVSEAHLIDTISYEEAMELAYFGAKVLHPPTVRPAWDAGIPIVIKNTFNPDCAGTLITNEPSLEDNTISPVRGISSLSPVSLVRLQGSGMVGIAGSSSRLFGALAAKKINVILISQSSSEYSICFAVKPEAAKPAAEALEEEFALEICANAIEKPDIEEDQAIIAVVGSGMRKKPGVSGKLFYALGKAQVSVSAIAQGSSEINISVVINKNDVIAALNAVHDVFFAANKKEINLFLVGLGLIGSTLQKQIEANPNKNVQIAALGDIKLDANFTIEGFIKQMIDTKLPGRVFCDCTASPEIASKYATILDAGIPVVTPNKRANSSSLSYYKQLMALSKERHTPYLYECTVGAALPVISVLKDMLATGDKILKIEAIVSGTLSYIFNSFSSGAPFSQLVHEAKSLGYTEPDPREDLKANDSARKVLILAREIGIDIEEKDVTIEPILPQSCIDAPTLEDFWAELEKQDSYFGSLRAKAAANGKVLRYIGSISKEGVSLSLASVGQNSPFMALSGADNMIVITTERYSERPLVIKGPGAGAAVTAGGIYADILRAV